MNQLTTIKNLLADPPSKGPWYECKLPPRPDVTNYNPGLTDDNGTIATFSPYSCKAVLGTTLNYLLLTKTEYAPLTLPVSTDCVSDLSPHLGQTRSLIHSIHL